MGTTDKDTISEALGKIVAGLYIVTASNGQRRTGFLASWVQQAGFDPPMVTVTVGKDRGIRTLLDEQGVFAVNIIGRREHALVSHFGRGHAPDVDPFASLNVSTGQTGAPILNDSLGYLECRVRGSLETGDHVVYVAEVVAGSLLSRQTPHIHVRKSGLRY